MNRKQRDLRIAAIAERVRSTYADGIGVNDHTGMSLPSRSEVIAVTEKLLTVLFPGFDRPENCDPMAEMTAIHASLSSQIRRAMRYKNSGRVRNCCKSASSCFCDDAALKLLEKIPEIREVVKLDIAAAYNGDPAATSYEEVVLSYPGLKAIAIQRFAHVLYILKVPLIPRMMTEYAHSVTGIDIHPGAQLGKGVFIDHGTGVVIGETAVLGDNVRIYQGVTLGAGNFPKDACGMLIKGLKRHPTIGSNVTIYSGASVLGDISIGDNSVIGGNVWLTESLPAGTKITAFPPETRQKPVGPAQPALPKSRKK